MGWLSVDQTAELQLKLERLRAAYKVARSYYNAAQLAELEKLGKQAAAALEASRRRSPNQLSLL